MSEKETYSTVKKDLNTDIGLRIHELRTAASITQEKLANELDVSVQYISRLERGLVGMSIPTLIDICEVLKTSPDYILKGDRAASDISPVISRLRFLSPEHLNIVERSINLIIEALDAD